MRAIEGMLQGVEAEGVVSRDIVVWTLVSTEIWSTAPGPDWFAKPSGTGRCVKGAY